MANWWETPSNEKSRPVDASKLSLLTKGWQVASIDATADAPGAGERSYNPLSKQESSGVVINCYLPGRSDEMHCHPGSEHTFLVWRGQLHLTGIEEGEDVTLGPGEFVHIAAGYYYRLHNPGSEMAVYCQFRTIPVKEPKRHTVMFSESHRGKQQAAVSG